MNVIVAGADSHEIAAAIQAENHDVTTIDVGSSDALEDAGIEGADTYVLTEMEQATSIAVAKDRNPDVRILIYADGSLPEFATRQADLVIDPALLDPDAVAEELA